MDEFRLIQMTAKLARLQRLATLAAGVKAAHPAMYGGDVVRAAQDLEDQIQQLDAQRYPGSEY